MGTRGVLPQETGPGTEDASPCRASPAPGVSVCAGRVSLPAQDCPGATFLQSFFSQWPCRASSFSLPAASAVIFGSRERPGMQETQTPAGPWHCLAPSRNLFPNLPPSSSPGSCPIPASVAVQTERVTSWFWVTTHLKTFLSFCLRIGAGWIFTFPIQEKIKKYKALGFFDIFISVSLPPRLPWVSVTVPWGILPSVLLLLTNSKR